ncbi:MAG: hypothetical protein IPO09_00470 [Anaeromyxobacter sp.]|nr:hypothetical protein [Anaeromyxobacter sp.]MBL0278356.1 hypothetical protein [Anaeromyxobacter sp.]
MEPGAAAGGGEAGRTLRSVAAPAVAGGLAAAALVALVATGVHLSATRDGRAKARATGEAQQAALRGSLDDLQARLLVGQARVRHWEEQRQRHAGVTALACAGNAWHADDMARLEAETRALRAQARAPRLATLAGLDPGLLRRPAAALLPAPPLDEPAGQAGRPPEAPSAGMGGD